MQLDVCPSGFKDQRCISPTNILKRVFRLEISNYEDEVEGLKLKQGIHLFLTWYNIM